MITKTLDAVDAYGAYLWDFATTAPFLTYVLGGAIAVGSAVLWHMDDTTDDPDQ